VGRRLRAHRQGEGDEPDEAFRDFREIAETVLFLASGGAGYINGQVIHVEGGWVPAG
jgi:NAD(P)-dependent dehydrogenase (short-subunit alcohol dehydrogenase family)